MARRLPAAARAPVILAFALAIAAWQVAKTRELLVFGLAQRHARAALAESYLSATLEPNAVLVSGEQSGAMRYYTGRPIVRWDFLDAPTLDLAIKRFRERSALDVWIVLDDWEVALFRDRFTGIAVGPEIKRAIESLNTRRPVYDLLPMRRYVERSMGDTRFTMLVLMCFAAASLLLAAIGVYGTLAYLTSQRTQEFGVRMALGASAAQVLRTVAGEGLWLAAAGGVAGFAGAALLSSGLRGLLYEVAPFDSATLVATAVLVAVVALIAAAHPAWRAARIDPVSALRAE